MKKRNRISDRIFVNRSGAKKRSLIVCMLLLLVLLVFPTPAAAAPSVKVDSLNFTKQGDGTYKVSWELSRLSGEALVRVSLSTSDHDHEVAAVELGSIKSGSAGNLTVTIPDVDSGFYHFLIDVTTMDAATGYAFSKDAIFYEDPYGAAELTGILAGRSLGKAYAVWEEESPAMIYIYDAKTKELLTKETSLSKPAALTIPDGHPDIIIGVAAFNGTAGNFTPIYCYENDIKGVSNPFMEEDVTNQKEVTILSKKEEGEFRLFKNREECRGRNGSYKISLDEGENTLVAFITKENGVTAVVEKNLLLDTIPPTLTLENTGTTVTTTKDHIFVQGYAESGALVTCDGDVVALIGDAFSIEKEIGFGSHTIKLSAADQAGNITSYNIEVNRSFWAGSGRLLILVIILAAIGAAGEIWLLFLRRKKNPPLKSGKENSALGSGKKNSVLGSEKKNSVLGSEKKNSALESEKKNSVLGSEKKNSALESEKNNSALGSGKKNSALGSEKKNSALESRKENSALVSGKEASSQEEEPFNSQGSEKL